jgi:hypothetical protein
VVGAMQPGLATAHMLQVMVLHHTHALPPLCPGLNAVLLPPPPAFNLSIKTLL